MDKKKVAFVCVHNSCRSQMAEAIGRIIAGDKFEFYSAGTEIKSEINKEAVEIIKELYGVDMTKTQHPKLISDIPAPDMAFSMGCEVACPFIGRPFDGDFNLEDPTGKSKAVYLKVISEIEKKIRELK